MKVTNLKLTNFISYENSEYNFDIYNVLYSDKNENPEILFKTIYAACLASNCNRTSFPMKLAGVFNPEDYLLSNLSMDESKKSTIVVRANDDNNDNHSLCASFSLNTSKYKAKLSGDEEWEKAFKGTSCVYIPSKEILSNCNNLLAAVRMGNVDFDDTITDIIETAIIDMNSDELPEYKVNQLQLLEKEIGGKVVYSTARDRFYINNGNKSYDLQLASSDVRGLAVIYKVIEKAGLKNGDVLLIPDIDKLIGAEYLELVFSLLSEMSKEGIQVFVSVNNKMKSIVTKRKKI